MATIVTEVATPLDFECRSTDQPAEVAKILKEWHPSLIFLDLQMPQADGVSYFRSIAEHAPDCRIVIMSGMDSRVRETAALVGRESGLKIIGSMGKPFAIGDLSRLIQGEKAAVFHPTASELALVIRRGEIVPLYQPIVDLRSGEMVGVELLARWNHPDRGLVLPEDFVPIAEANNLEPSLFFALAEAGMASYAKMPVRGARYSLAINASSHSLTDRLLPNRLSELCAEYRVPARNITVEFTENAVTECGSALEVLVRLRVAGFRLSLDDFGTGRLSLKGLRELPLTEMKIDKSFTLEARQSSDAAAICRTIIGMARNLDLACVAEGIESAEVARDLADWGCAVGQGFHYAKPVALDRLNQLEFQGVERQRETAEA